MVDLISVILPVFNGEKYLCESIESILNQTYVDFEFIIINDGSSDNSLEIIRRYSKLDKRILVISRENKGLIESLNEGIKKSKGKYIARMDQDDISYPKRFEKQIKFMEENNLDICGANVQTFLNGSNQRVWKYPVMDRDIKFCLIFFSTFAHPTVIIKKEIFKFHKYDEYRHAEDYNLWTKFALSKYKMGNVPKVLLKYRLHDVQTSKIYLLEQEKYTRDISIKYLKQSQPLYVQKKIIGFLEEHVLSAEDLGRIFKTIKELGMGGKVSEEFILFTIRYIYKNLKKINFKTYLIYFYHIKNYKINFIDEIILFLASIFGASKSSKIYYFLTRKIK